MTIAQDIINDGLLFAGVGDQYNALDANTQALSLRVLNSLTDSWSTEELTIFDVVEGTVALPTSGVNTLTIGPGFGLGTRPVYVERLAIVDAQNVTHPVDIIGVDEWARIIYKPAVGRPEVSYNDGGVPTSLWYFWPTPSFAGDNLHAWYWNVLPTFATGATSLVAPPAYEWFLKTNLGVAMAPFFGKQMTPEQLRLARAAKKNARRANNQPKVLETDLPSNYVRTFNIYTGA